MATWIIALLTWEIGPHDITFTWESINERPEISQTYQFAAGQYRLDRLA
jgi:hypothetical protein